MQIHFGYTTEYQRRVCEKESPLLPEYFNKNVGANKGENYLQMLNYY